MRQALLILALVFSGCFPSTKQGWFTGANLRGEGLCFWKNMRWHDNGVLLAPETGLPMARARSVWGSKNAWRGAMVSGSLKKAGPYFLFQGTWRGDGIILDADVDASGQPVFAAYATVRAGPAGLLPRGADVVVVEGQQGRLQVMPPDEAMAEFMPSERPVAEMACEALTLYPQHADALEWSGFPKDAPEVELSLAAALPVRAAPGGEVVGGFHARQEPLGVRRIETQGDWTRVAYVHSTGVVWHGWVPSSAVREPEDASGGVVGGMLGGLLGSLVEESGWLACAVEQRLYAGVGGRVVHVGRVTAATPFKPGLLQERFVAVSFRSSWLDPEDGVTFFMDASAAGCAPWIAPAPPPSKAPVPQTL
ncbi:MAG: hypothetical protein AB1938_03645 [Myxococcota bacterium]